MSSRSEMVAIDNFEPQILKKNIHFTKTFYDEKVRKYNYKSISALTFKIGLNLNEICQKMNLVAKICCFD